MTKDALPTSTDAQEGLKLGTLARNTPEPPKDDSKEMPLHASTLQESDGSTTKLEDRGITRSYDSITNESDPSAADVKVYKYRFWILFLFFSCALLNGVHWGQYTIMADVTKCFYDVDIYAVDWTANIFIILYIPLGFPVSWLMNRFGIRITILLGSFCSCLSSTIQCFTLQPDTFAFVMLSQAMGAVSLVFFMSTPPHLAAVWFGPEELSCACSTGIAADMAGVALGFMLTPTVVPHDCSVKSEISRGKRIMAYSLTAVNLVLFALAWATFRDKPEKPPSISRANKMDYEPSYKKTFMDLCKTKNFMLLFISYGIFSGTTTSIGVIINPILLPHFPGKHVEIGWISLTAVVAGIIGCIFTGLILDKTHAFKKLFFTLNILMVVSLVALAALIETNILWIQFIINFVVGFVANSHFSVGLEFASEITYPEPELIVTYLMNVSATIFSVLITMIGSWLEENHGNLALFSFFEVFLVIGTIFTAFTKCSSKRTEQNEAYSNLE